MQRGRISINIAKVTPCTVLKSDAHENSTFPLAMALGSAMPHTACRSDFAVLKSDAHENSTFPLAMALGSAMPHTACQSDSAVLKSDAHENSTFPLAMALGSAMPHTACQSDFAVLKSDVREKRGFPSQGAFLLCVQSAPSDFAVACAGLVGKNVLVYRTGSSSGFAFFS